MGLFFNNNDDDLGLLLLTEYENGNATSVGCVMIFVDLIPSCPLSLSPIAYNRLWLSMKNVPNVVVWIYYKFIDLFIKKLLTVLVNVWFSMLFCFDIALNMLLVCNIR